MALRGLAVFAAVSALLGAPYPCGRSEDPALRREETAAEALYAAAAKLRDAGDERGFRLTLTMLVERYPSSRWAQMASMDLTADGGSAIPTP